MLQAYWPTEDQVSKCIRAEAEELSEHVLMAVHEPMILEKKLVQIGESHLFYENAEQALIENIKSSERPVPILGDSGTGKSHLIRLVDITLRNDPSTQDWIIRRIPKSASLREVLTILLDGLEGDLFESARKRIKDVGQQLKTREVAEHLIVFMGHRLKERYDGLQEEIAQIKQSGIKPSDEKRAQIEAIKRHANLNSLPSLLGDSNYKETLIKEGGCIYQIAKRLTSGSSEAELIENNYQLTPDDLDFNLNLGDLSLAARNYVNDKSLNTMTERRKEAVNLLNEVISEACNKVFQHLFQLHGGNFLDLFAEIRRYLKGRTLVILVEDMSLITAIESDLITSLTREGVRDGNEEMCVVRSAIAVTTGYEGYARHRNSIVGRNAGFEWNIIKVVDNSETLSGRVQDFCGRYLNASRHGNDKLKEYFKNFVNNGNSYPVWQSQEQDVLDRAQAFGNSPSGFPLFPFNKVSIDAYIQKYCRDVSSNEIVFNPRMVLKHFLIENLSTYRHIYVEKQFPPAGFGGFNCASSLAGEIKRNVHKDIERSMTLASIWGFGATKLGELSSVLSSNVAREFGLDELATCLDATAATPIRKPAGSGSGTKTALQGGAKSATQGTSKNTGSDAETEPDVSAVIADKVERYFDRKSIDQSAAKELRKSLLALITQNVSASDLLKWNCFNKQSFPKLTSGDRVLIHIPYNANNPERTWASFGSEKEFKNNSLPYKSFLIAILRFERYGNWNYEEGYSDYCEYQNFASKWVPEAINQIVEKAREGLKDKIREHLSLAVALEPTVANKTNTDKLAYLCRSKEEFIANHQKTGIEQWDNLRDKLISDWPEKQKQWLDLVSINNHALEGETVLRALHGQSVETIPYAREVQVIHRDIKARYPSFQLLQGVTNKEDFVEMMTRLLDLINKMSSNSQYQGMVGNLTAKQLTNRITKIINGEHWNAVKSALVMFELFEVNKAIMALNNFTLSLADEVAEVLETWKLAYKANLQRMKNENKVNGGEARAEYKQQIDTKLQQLKESLNELAVEETENV
ncbi:protein DpdH [Pseudoalteromonas sp.]|uniref:protein DpdH n=1 Tax=Pseudoalteromonas sp. TaxID=53249 RepID=UPI00262F419F|nr:protein DpdH [Pseudoalteromonas sp.]MCP4588325.1 hypothetical protein [Pseudoalteromonas sp.]